MSSPTGIIPETLMLPGKKREVIEFLKAKAYPGTMKRELLLGWAQTVGLRLQQKDFREVDESGVEG